jgi:hypothetical protein
VTATADGVGRFSRRAALAVLGVVTAAGAAIAVAGAVIARGSPQGRFERTLAVSGPTNIAITTGSGSILVRPGDSSTVRVVGNIQVSADWNEDEREAQEKVRRIEQIRRSTRTGTACASARSVMTRCGGVFRSRMR